MSSSEGKTPWSRSLSSLRFTSRICNSAMYFYFELTKLQYARIKNDIRETERFVDLIRNLSSTCFSWSHQCLYRFAFFPRTYSCSNYEGVIVYSMRLSLVKWEDATLDTYSAWFLFVFTFQMTYFPIIDPPHLCFPLCLIPSFAHTY